MKLDFSIELNVTGLTERVLAAASDGVADGCDHVLGVSNTMVPFEFGDLEASGRTATEGLEGIITYDSPYAVAQHEGMDFYHKNGRQAKYLENALNSEQAKVLDYIGKRIKGAL